MKGLSLIAVDSFSKWSEQLHMYHKRVSSNWEIYNGFNSDNRNMFNKYIQAQTEIPIVFFVLPEILEIDTENPNVSSRETHAKIYGKELRGTLEKEFTIVLGCEQNDEDEHFFRVHGTSTLPFKTPRGMFKEDLIPNDLEIVRKRALEFLGMVPHMMVLGRSGTGKSSSLENLDPATTAIVNVENKPLPFRNAGKFKLHFRLPLSVPSNYLDIPSQLTRDFEKVMDSLVYGDGSLTPQIKEGEKLNAKLGQKKLRIKR